MSSNALNLDIKLPALHPIQEEVRQGLKRFTIMRAGRQIGKSWLASNLSIEKAFEKPNQFIMVLAPSYKQTEAIYGRIRKLLKPLINKTIGGETIVTENKADMRLNFFNGSTIIAATADNPDRLRGYSINFVILDEAATIPNNELWVEVLRPALAATQGQALFISTPKGKSNWFYDLWLWAEADIAERPETTPWALFHFKSTDSPYFPEEEAQEARKLGENVYLQEYEAEFVATRNRMIGEGQFHYFSLAMANDQTYLTFESDVWPQNRLLRAMTVDLAVKVSTKTDQTAYAMGDITHTGIVFVRDVWAGKLEGYKIAKDIARYVKRNEVQVVYVESVAFQLAVIQELMSLGVSVQPIPAKGDKIARAALLGVRMDNRQVLWPKGAVWLPATIDEVTSFPDGVYDDRTDALGYLAHVAVEHSQYGHPGMATNITINDVVSATKAGAKSLDSLTKEMRKEIAMQYKMRGGMALEKMRGRI